MYKTLRIIFSILAAACATVVIFVFVLCDWWWGFIPLGVGLLSAALMFLFKKLQEREELKKNPPPPRGDFITGKVKTDEVKPPEDNGENNV